MKDDVRIPLNSVVKYSNGLYIYAGILNDKHTLLNVKGESAFVRIEDFEYDGLVVERYPVELAAQYIRSKGGEDE